MADFRQIAEQSKASQGSKELLWLLERVEAIKPKVIVEIGVHQGYSMQTWKEAFNPDILIGIDNDLHALKWDNGTIINGNSQDHKTAIAVARLLDGREIDFLFIDGDHMYNGVKKDFEMYAPLVRTGGIIAYDDMDLFDNPSVEVYKFWNEIKDRWKSEQYHADSNGIGIIYV